jgi:hypothetical protein
MITTVYRELLIQHPVITPKDVKDVFDWYGTSYHIPALDNDCGSLESAKLNIDSLYQDMAKFNADNPEDAVSNIYEYIEACLYA